VRGVGDKGVGDSGLERILKLQRCFYAMMEAGGGVKESCDVIFACFLLLKQFLKTTVERRNNIGYCLFLFIYLKQFIVVTRAIRARDTLYIAHVVENYNIGGEKLRRKW
jgi:hypothetical protein